MYDYPHELQFAKVVRWLLKKVYGQEFVVVPRSQWDAMNEIIRDGKEQ